MYEHPAVYSAHGLSGQGYKVDLVFDNKITGGKSVVVILDNVRETRMLTKSNNNNKKVS